MSASSGKVSVWLLVILLPLGAVSLWYGYRETHESDAPVPSAMQSKWHFQSEDHWLVDETARDIAEMLAFAKDGHADKIAFTTTPETGKPESYTLHAKLDGTDVTARMQWRDYIWSPEEYQPWVKQVVTALKLTAPATATNDAALVQALTSPTPEVIHREAARVSEALTKAPLDPGLHEQAALITAAFALREAAGTFGDSRREICRIAAHLAIAEGLQPASHSPVRKFADAALQTLSGRETPALAVLAELEHDSTPGADAWVRALRFRNTGDWRQEAPQPTVFEQLETFLAREKSVSSEFLFRPLKFNFQSRLIPANIVLGSRVTKEFSNN